MFSKSIAVQYIPLFSLLCGVSADIFCINTARLWAKIGSCSIYKKTGYNWNEPHCWRSSHRPSSKYQVITVFMVIRWMLMRTFLPAKYLNVIYHDQPRKNSSFLPRHPTESVENTCVSWRTATANTPTQSTLRNTVSTWSMTTLIRERQILIIESRV